MIIKSIAEKVSLRIAVLEEFVLDAYIGTLTVYIFKVRF
jgi:hypothetical protein